MLPPVVAHEERVLAPAAADVEQGAAAGMDLREDERWRSAIVSIGTATTSVKLVRYP